MDAPKVPRHANAVVVGGGCMGASAAFHLARRGLDVVLVEKDHVGAGATGHSGAIVRQHYETRVGIRLARDSLAFFNRFEEETSLSCDFRRTGFLSGARERDVRALEALLALLRAERVKAQRLGPEEAAEMEPQLDISDYAAVVHDPDAGYADPIAAAVGFAESARRSGAAVIEGRSVNEIGTRKGRVAGIRIRRGGLIESEHVIVAAGNWTPAIVRKAGVRLPIRFVRGEVAILRRPPGFGSPPRVHFDFYGNTYSRPESEKEMLVGYMDTDPRRAVQGPELRDDAIAAATVRDLRARLGRRFPIMARAQRRGGGGWPPICNKDLRRGRPRLQRFRMDRHDPLAERRHRAPESSMREATDDRDEVLLVAGEPHAEIDGITAFGERPGLPAKLCEELCESDLPVHSDQRGLLPHLVLLGQVLHEA